MAGLNDPGGFHTSNRVTMTKSKQSYIRSCPPEVFVVLCQLLYKQPPGPAQFKIVLFVFYWDAKQPKEPNCHAGRSAWKLYEV